MEYILSDPHFNHDKIIEYSNRPFKNSKEMNECIMDNWNDTVSHNHLVYLLGDVMWSRNAEEVIQLLEKLKGRKCIVLGNHDKELFGLFKQGKFRNPNERIFIAPPIHEVKVRLTRSDVRDKVVLCHYPIASWNGHFHGRKHFYGHLHEKTLTNLPNSYNVCVEEIGYKPLMFREVLEHYDRKQNKEIVM